MRLIPDRTQTAFLQALGDALLTTPNGNDIPASFGWHVFSRVCHGTFPAVAEARLYLRHLIAADPGGACLLLYQILDGSPVAQSVLTTLAQRISPEQWATGRYERLRSLLNPMLNESP